MVAATKHPPKEQEKIIINSAVKSAEATRLRPILMTTAAIVLALLYNWLATDHRVRNKVATLEANKSGELAAA